METDIDGQWCRIKVHCEDSARDFALPADLPLCDALPQIRSRFDGEIAQRPESGWLMTTVMGTPVDSGKTPRQLELTDGQHLRLVPEADFAPPRVVEDVVEVAADTARWLPGRWRDPHSRGLALAVGYLGLATGAAALAIAVPRWPAVAVGFAAAVPLFAVAAVLARRGDRDLTADAFALAAIGYAAVAGLRLGGSGFGPESLAAAGAAGFGFAALARLYVGGTAVLGFGYVGAMTAGYGALGATGAGLVAAAAVMALPLVLSLFLAPAAAVLLARLTPPHRQAESRAEPVEVNEVARRTAAANRILTALLYGTSACLATAAVVLAVDGSTPSLLLAAMLALLCLVRCRSAMLRRHRYATAGAALTAAAAVLTAVLAGGSATAIPATAAVLATTGLLCLWRLETPNGWATPTLLRVAFLTEILLSLGLIPAIAWTTGLFAWFNATT